MELEGVATVSVKAEVEEEEEEQPALDLSKTKVAIPGLKTEPKVEVVDDDDDDDEEDEVVRRSRPPDTTTASLQGGWNLYCVSLVGSFFVFTALWSRGTLEVGKRVAGSGIQFQYPVTDGNGNGGQTENKSNFGEASLRILFTK